MLLFLLNLCSAASKISIKNAIVIRSELTRDNLLSYFSESFAIFDASQSDFSSLLSEIDWGKWVIPNRLNPIKKLYSDTK